MSLKPSLLAMGLIAEGEDFTVEPLAANETSEIFSVATKRRGIVCVKCALPKGGGRAGGRSQAEVAWMKLVGGIDPDWVPMVLGEDKARQTFAMEFLPPQTHCVWQCALAADQADSVFAAKAGERLARIHAETAGRPDLARDFDYAASFHAARIVPCFIAAANRYGAAAQSLRVMARNLAASRIALMHGDMCPANILCGPEGPVFLGARTCCYGDPAFDLAFLLAALLPRRALEAAQIQLHSACFAAVKEAYFARATWESRGGLERRTAGFLGALLVAGEADEGPFAAALSCIKEGVSHLDVLQERWTEALLTRQI